MLGDYKILKDYYQRRGGRFRRGGLLPRGGRGTGTTSYINKPCNKYNSFKGCRDGSSCRYQHIKPDPFKLDTTHHRICSYYNSRRGCRKGKRCKFRHQYDYTAHAQSFGNFSMLMR
eukprot:523347_1